MANNTPSEQADHALEAAANGETLQKLGGIQRVRESTLGAIGNIFGGARRLFRKGERLDGIAQMGQGVLDALDIIPSALADANRFVWGPKETKVGRGPSGSITNTGRAIKGVDDVNSVPDAIGVAGDVVHALGFKLASYALALARNQRASYAGIMGADAPKKTVRATQATQSRNTRRNTKKPLTIAM